MQHPPQDVRLVERSTGARRKQQTGLPLSNELPQYLSHRGMQVDLPPAVLGLEKVVHLALPRFLADADAGAIQGDVRGLDAESFPKAQPGRGAKYEEHAVHVPQFALHVHIAFGVPVRVFPRGHDAGHYVAREARRGRPGSTKPGLAKLGLG